MYNLYDYLQNGWTFLHNLLRPRHKTLTSLMIYSTTRCQSRCQHCSIWKKPAEHLSLDDIRRIMESKCVTARTTVGLEGGEFLLHPEADAILGWFDAHHPNYTLLSNALAPQKLTQMLEKHHPKHLYLSLDGDKSTYRHMRGVDGYEQVMQVIEQWHERIPISLMFCLSPWNSFRDMEHVIAVAKRYGIDVRIGSTARCLFRHHFGTDRHGTHRFPAADSAVDPRNGRKLRFRGALRRVEKSTPAVALPQYLQRAGDSFQRRRADLPKIWMWFWGTYTNVRSTRFSTRAKAAKHSVATRTDAMNVGSTITESLTSSSCATSNACCPNDSSNAGTVATNGRPIGG